MAHRDLDFDDEKPDQREGMHFEFECPDCNAHNPYDDGFRVGSEVLCFYCGNQFKVAMSEGKLKLKDL